MLLCTYFASLWGWITWELDECLKRHNTGVSALKSRYSGVRGKRGEASLVLCVLYRLLLWMIQ